MKSSLLGLVVILCVCAVSVFFFQYWKNNLTRVSEQAARRVEELARAKEDLEAQYRWKLEEMDKVHTDVDTTLKACFGVFEKAVSLLDKMGEKAEVADAESQPPREPTDVKGWTSVLRERQEKVKEELDRLLSDEKVAELYEFYKRNENRFEEWAFGKFLEDPKINPNHVILNQQDMMRLELAYNRAVYRIKMKDTERELALQRAVSEKLMERAEYITRGEMPPKPNSRFVDVVAVVQQNNMTVTIPREEHPEIGVLLLERDPEIARWLKEVSDFFAAK
jgi:hypothetical protein